MWRVLHADATLLARLGGQHVYIKGVTERFGFDAIRTSQLLRIVKSKATGTSQGCFICTAFVVSCRQDARGRIIYKHRRGAFGVARFDRLGNARALMRGTSDRYSSHAFFVVNLLEGDEGEGKKQCI